MSRQTGISEKAFDRDRPVYGAKLALFMGGRLAVILRDDFPTIPHPAHWDFPGGGRERGESAVDCVLRETWEELGVSLDAGDLQYGRVYHEGTGREVWFFAAHLPEARLPELRLGDEGQEWRLMTTQEYAAHPRAIPSFRERLSEYLNQAG